ncbi:amidohydrolase family protein [Novosphingobium sp. fls2-241-R2A-195]|uniref:amidohydrolase family protein n=1 Tax=Novosphingobium sp. fls2-241-R2A-195 TaxID=3040296 RepID=UPI00254FC9BC|nr:amidohydrolase family protein [Novosphingobium sp. fls2-241-R2A-195]
MLIRNAEIWGTGPGDVRIEGPRIASIGTLLPRSDEQVIDARGGLLLPGLHDHHIHLAALAAQQSSISCGQPDVLTSAQLARALQAPGTGWLRGVGFHESVLDGVLPDAAMLDRMVADRPLRMQHRTGRMWLLNSRALEELLAIADAPPGLERAGGRFTGRLFEEDAWLSRTLGGSLPDFAQTSARLARCGVTGITDMSPRNDPGVARHFAQQRSDGRLLQSSMIAGSLALGEHLPPGCTLGPLKLHLHENALPDFDEAVALVRSGHAQNRAVAVHCVTEVELVFALAVLEVAGSVRGDRIEHVSVASPDLVSRMRDLGLSACVQPHFIAERGDRYLADVDPRHHADLYRLRSLAAASLPLAGGSDAPYGEADPWKSMTAAVNRRAPSGAVIGADEGLTPEEALALYLTEPADFSRQRAIAVGAMADLCLMDRPWSEVRARLDKSDVRMVIAGGNLVHQRIDQSPLERLLRADASA